MIGRLWVGRGGIGGFQETSEGSKTAQETTDDRVEGRAPRVRIVIGGPGGGAATREREREDKRSYEPYSKLPSKSLNKLVCNKKNTSALLLLSITMLRWYVHNNNSPIAHWHSLLVLFCDFLLLLFYPHLFLLPSF